MMDRIGKVCTQCGEDKSLDLFSPHNLGKSGRHPWCRACMNEKARQRPSRAKATRRSEPKSAAMQGEGGAAYSDVAELKDLIEKIKEQIAVPSGAGFGGACRWCGAVHGLRCPAVAAMEFHPDGTVKRVEFVQPQPITAAQVDRRNPNIATQIGGAAHG